MLGKCQVLQLIWISHVTALDLQVGGVPLAVLLRLDGVIEQLLELPRRRLFYALHELHSPELDGKLARASISLLRVALEEEGWTLASLLWTMHCFLWFDVRLL